MLSYATLNKKNMDFLVQLIIWSIIILGIGGIIYLVFLLLKMNKKINEIHNKIMKKNLQIT